MESPAFEFENCSLCCEYWRRVSEYAHTTCPFGSSLYVRAVESSLKSCHAGRSSGVEWFIWLWHWCQQGLDLPPLWALRSDGENLPGPWKRHQDLKDLQSLACLGPVSSFSSGSIQSAGFSAPPGRCYLCGIDLSNSRKPILLEFDQSGTPPVSCNSHVRMGNSQWDSRVFFDVSVCGSSVYKRRMMLGLCTVQGNDQVIILSVINEWIALKKRLHTV